MSHTAVMVQAIEFIERNLKQEIKVADIAEAVSYSLYHFCRVFNQVVHHSPYDYLMRRRLSGSAQELLTTDRTITDIAFEYQFNSPETYSRAFKRMFDMQPSQWKKQGRLDRRFLMSRLSPAYLQHINKGNYLRPILAEKKALRLAGLMTLVEAGDHQAMPRLRTLVAQELDAMGDVGSPEGCYGVVWYPRDWERHGFFYMAAIEIGDSEIAESALVTKTIPPLNYARFIHNGSVEDRQLTLDYIYQTWLPKSGSRLSCSLEIEDYGEEWGGLDREQVEWAIYIPIERGP